MGTVDTASVRLQDIHMLHQRIVCRSTLRRIQLQLDAARPPSTAPSNTATETPEDVLHLLDAEHPLRKRLRLDTKMNQVQRKAMAMTARSIQGRSTTPVVLLKSRPSTPMTMLQPRRSTHQQLVQQQSVVAAAAVSGSMSGLPAASSGTEIRDTDVVMQAETPPRQSSFSHGMSSTPSLGGSGTGARAYHSRKTPDHRVRKCKPITQNPDGTWTISARYGKVTVLSLGEIVPNDANYETDRYLFPVGFQSSRLYSSTTDPNNEQVEYISSIEKGDQGPSVCVSSLMYLT